MKDNYELLFTDLLKKYDIQVKKRKTIENILYKHLKFSLVIALIFAAIIVVMESSITYSYVIGISILFVFNFGGLFYLESRCVPTDYFDTSIIKDAWEQDKTKDLCSVKKRTVCLKLETMTRIDETGKFKAVVIKLFAPKTPERIPFFLSMHGQDGPQTTMCSEREIDISKQNLSILKELPNTVEATYLVMELFPRYGGWKFLLPVGENWQLLETQMDDLCRLIIQDITLSKLRNAVNGQTLLEKNKYWEETFISSEDIIPYFTKKSDGGQPDFWKRSDAAQVYDNITAYIDEVATSRENFSIPISCNGL